MDLLTKLVLTERDYEIMRDLYRLRALTVPQIAALHFPQVTSGDFQAARKRLRRLAQAGYLSPRRWVVKDGPYWKIAGVVYMLADPGMHEVCEHYGLKHRKAEDNAVESWRFELHLLAAQIAVAARLGNIPWEWLEAREAKSRYDIPPGSLFSGILEGRTGSTASRVGLYAVPPNLSRGWARRVLMDTSMFGKYFRNGEILIVVPREPERLRSTLANLPQRGMSIRVLTLSGALKVLREFLPDPRSALSAWLGAELSPASVPPARWQVPGEFYIADCATGDVYPLRALQTQKGWNGRLPLKLVAPASWEGHLTYPGVEVVPPPPGWDTLVPPVPELAACGDNQEPEEAGDFDEDYEETWYRQPDGWTEEVVK